jgi:hypothetical protein
MSTLLSGPIAQVLLILASGPYASEPKLDDIPKSQTNSLTIGCSRDNGRQRKSLVFVEELGVCVPIVLQSVSAAVHQIDFDANLMILLEFLTKGANAIGNGRGLCRELGKSLHQGRHPLRHSKGI